MEGDVYQTVSRLQRFFEANRRQARSRFSLDVILAGVFPLKRLIVIVREVMALQRLYRPKRAASRIVSIFAVVFLLTVTANAYTVVMRGGRRIEIPSRFVVTPSTLTYEAGPGIQITLEMAAIDVAATEKANNEAPGGLLRRGQSLAVEIAKPAKSPEGQKSGTQASQARRTITNRDLESSRRRRRDSEVAYERKRKELGLPSVEESRRQAAADSEAIEIELEHKRLAESESENYWRGRAATLRTEMAALDAELAYVRARINEGPFAMSDRWANGSFTSVTGGVPFISFGNFGSRSFGTFGVPRFPAQRPNVFVAPGAGGQITGRGGFRRGATRGQVFLNPGTVRPESPIGFGGRFAVFPSFAVLGSTVGNYDVSYERSALITRFNELAAAKAGLNARWRELEEEARRAGAPPGWLRP